jgi:hypothetical protein
VENGLNDVPSQDEHKEDPGTISERHSGKGQEKEPSLIPLSLSTEEVAHKRPNPLHGSEASNSEAAIDVSVPPHNVPPTPNGEDADAPSSSAPAASRLETRYAADADDWLARNARTGRHLLEMETRQEDTHLRASIVRTVVRNVKKRMGFLEVRLL